MGRYLITAAAMPTTASGAVVATGTALKTLLQAKPFNLMRIIEWGVSFDGFAAALPGKVELIETDVAATVTALADADVSKHGPAVGDMAAASVAGLTLSTSGTGFNATAEGTIAASRYLDAPMFLPPTGPFVKQFPLGREPIVQIAKFARIRVLFGTTVNAYPYMVVEF